MANTQWLCDGTAFARWQKAQMQCAWCMKIGNYYFNHGCTDDTQEYFNWKVTMCKEPGTIICNICYKRREPPHVERYLKLLDKTSKTSFDKLGDLIINVAEFAYLEYASWGPKQVAQALTNPCKNDEFPAGRRQPVREMMRREKYPDMTLGESLDYVHNWLRRTCPICENKLNVRLTSTSGPLFDHRTWCNHHRPAMQLQGERGITLSFDRISPSLQRLGMQSHQIHSGLRSITERIHDINESGAENLFLELDMDGAWQKAGYAAPYGDEAEAFMHRRHQMRRLFPGRDIHCVHEGDTEERTMEELDHRLSLGWSPATTWKHACNNCGRACFQNPRVYGMHNGSFTVTTRVMEDLYGNRQLTCRDCSGIMCMGCANDFEEPTQAVCFGCLLKWQRDWVAGKSPNPNQPTTRAAIDRFFAATQSVATSSCTAKEPDEYWEELSPSQD